MYLIPSTPFLHLDEGGMGLIEIRATRKTPVIVKNSSVRVIPMSLDP